MPRLPRQTVHPHTRGDNHRPGCIAQRPDGSPPHACGQLRSACAGAARSRFTPTRVGTTCTASIIYSFGRGSPPHAWGQRGEPARAPHPARFTPTRVGTTFIPEVWDARISVHPHTRGDNKLLTAIVRTPFGSPPHAWGQPRLSFLLSCFIRFTPTRVGTTPAGKVLFRHGRFTPTRVGTTLPGAWRRGALAVHPHTRGDNHRQLTELARALRFTPTRVGTTASWCRIPTRRSVHPHTRGDNTLVLLAMV